MIRLKHLWHGSLLIAVMLGCDTTLTAADYAGTWTGSDATFSGVTLHLRPLGADSLGGSLAFSVVSNGTRIVLDSTRLVMQLVGDSVQFWTGLLPLPSTGYFSIWVTGRRIPSVLDVRAMWLYIGLNVGALCPIGGGPCPPPVTEAVVVVYRT